MITQGDVLRREVDSVTDAEGERAAVTFNLLNSLGLGEL